MITNVYLPSLLQLISLVQWLLHPQEGYLSVCLKQTTMVYMAWVSLQLSIQTSTNLFEGKRHSKSRYLYIYLQTMACHFEQTLHYHVECIVVVELYNIPVGPHEYEANQLRMMKYMQVWPVAALQLICVTGKIHSKFSTCKVYEYLDNDMSLNKPYTISC